jgi:hypothetical protein
MSDKKLAWATSDLHQVLQTINAAYHFFRYAAIEDEEREEAIVAFYALRDILSSLQHKMEKKAEREELAH